MLDGHVYAIGGWDGCGRLDSVERYNPQLNTWTFIPSMKIALTSPAVVAHRGILYVTGTLNDVPPFVLPVYTHL